MPQITGIDIAKKLRIKLESTEIIFVTNKDEMVYDIIQYTPFRFIRKSRLEIEIEEALETYLKKKNHQNAIYFFSTEQGKKPVNIVTIVYIEVKSHKLTIYEQDKVFSANGNLNTIEKEISQYGFIRIHKSYLVNFRYINLICQKEVTLDNGNTLPLSRRKFESTKKELMRFSREIS